LDVTFTAKVQAIGRVAIPLEIRERLRIQKGDMVTVKIEKVLQRRQRA
jgi:AbrB family looped-hinge helix DNA binding protein